MQRFGHNMKERRLHLKLTQRELGVKTELHPTQISEYERGATVPSLRIAQRIAEALETSVTKLMEG